MFMPWMNNKRGFVRNWLKYPVHIRVCFCSRCHKLDILILWQTPSEEKALVAYAQLPRAKVIPIDVDLAIEAADFSLKLLNL